MLYEILYTSLSKEKFDAASIQTLLQQCYDNNVVNNITGCMVFKKREFIQVIEGEKEVVLQLFEKIKKDERHSKLKVIWQGKTLERSFEKWLMGFYNFNELDKNAIEGFTDILKEGISKASKTGYESVASRLFTLLSDDLRHSN